MVSWKVSSVLVFLFISCAISPTALYQIPEVMLEALNSGGFRAFIKNVPGTNYFIFHGTVNDEPTEYHKERRTPQDGFWVAEFPKPLKVGDIVSYTVKIIYVISNHVSHENIKLQWKVTELLDSYTMLKERCVKVSTTVNGRKSVCAGKSIINDEFKDGSINKDVWVPEHFIPIYAGPNSEFNSYENRDETRFIRNGILYLKPIALQFENDVRGVLNLTSGCTSHVDTKCSYTQKSSFLLPPVKSARITSKNSFRYGKIEIRAKLPAGDWIFPILQLQPQNYVDENSPTVWIAYSRGNDHLKGNAGEDIGSRVLYGGPVLHPMEPGRSKELVSQSSDIRPYNSDFHVYTLNWLPGKMTLSIDSEEYGTVNSEASFDKEYVLSLGVGVGGTTNFPDHYTTGNNVQKPWSNEDRNQVKKFFEARHDWLSTWSSPALQIDYVKVTTV